MFHSYYTVFLLFVISCLHSVAYAEDRALIIGINKYQYIGELPGCVKDATNIQQTFANLNIYQYSQTRILTDEQATRQAILDGLEWLSAGGQPGDKVLFYFSGHGAQQVDKNGDEPDGLDETLCPVDTSLTRGNMITDDEIDSYLQRLKDRKVLVIIDACHSGTITKNFFPTSAKFKTPFFTTPLPQMKGFTTEAAVTHPKEEMVVYTAVDANQLAVATAQGSVFTNAFIKAIQSNPDNISNDEILKLVREESETECKKRQSECTPQMELGSLIQGNRPLIEIFPPMNKPIIGLDLLFKILPSATANIGDKVTFEIENRTQQDGYAIIWDIDSAGKITLLFPKEVSDNNGIISAKKSVNFSFHAEEPKGKGKCIAVLVHDELIAQKLINFDYSTSKNKGFRRAEGDKPDLSSIAASVKKKLLEHVSEMSIVLKDYEITD